MRSLVIVRRRGPHYITDASGKFGGGFRGAGATTDPAQAACFAASMVARYSISNPDGGDLIAPPEVLALIPARLHDIPEKGKTQWT
jgi:hypothetical protein